MSIFFLRPPFLLVETRTTSTFLSFLFACTKPSRFICFELFIFVAIFTLLSSLFACYNFLFTRDNKPSSSSSFFFSSFFGSLLYLGSFIGSLVFFGFGGALSSVFVSGSNYSESQSKPFFLLGLAFSFFSTGFLLAFWPFPSLLSIPSPFLRSSSSSN